MKKIVTLGLILIIACVLNGCGGSRGTISKSFDSASINKIIIEAGDHPVLLQNTEAEEITISLNGYDGKIDTVENQTLKLQLPLPRGGVNFKSPSELVVGIPSKWNGNMEIDSNVGNIKLNNIVLPQLSIKSDCGDVSLSGLSGTVSAKSDVGKVEVPARLADKVKPGDMDLGATFEASIGNAEGSDNKINIHTNTGNIKIN